MDARLAKFLLVAGFLMLAVATIWFLYQIDPVAAVVEGKITHGDASIGFRAARALAGVSIVLLLEVLAYNWVE